MAYDKGLAERARNLLKNEAGFNEKKMFGGVCFLLRGNMMGGILDKNLIVRVGPDRYEDSLKLSNTKQFDITGRPMKGWVMVSNEGLKTKKELVAWIKKGMDFALTLPAK